MLCSLNTPGKTLIALLATFLCATPLRAAVDVPSNRSVRGPLTTAGGSLRGEYWKRPINTIATDGNTNPTNRVDEQIKRFGSPTGTFTARTFVYLGNDLTPVTNWLAGDSASFVGPTNNLDDGAFRFTGFINVTNAGIVNIGVNTDDGARIKIGGIDVVANDGGHGDQTADTDVNFLGAGLYPIEITYFNGDWTSDGTNPVNHSGNPDPGVHGGANFRLRMAGADVTPARAAILFPPTVLGPPANIVWVSFHAGDTNPSAAAVTAGFTRAPDVGYTDLLRANGHNVTRVLSSDIPNTNLLNAADLVIISRSVPSGHYELDAETAAWNSISTPTIILGGYVIRQNRLGYMASNTIPDVNSAAVRLTVTNASHPVFAGIALDGSNTMVNPYANRVTFTNNLQLGISVVTGATAPGGTVLARIGTAGDAAFGGMAIGEWPAGAVMSTAPPDTLGGRRLVFLTGSRENGGLTSEGAGIYDLDSDGAQMFLNAVRYMAKSSALPPYAAAVLADGPIAYYRFSDTNTTALNSGSLGAAVNGTYTGGAVAGAEAPKPPGLIGFETNNTALQLNGTNAYVTTISGLLNGRTNFTISGWIRRNGTQNNRTGLFGQNDLIEYGYIDNNTLQLWTDNALNVAPNPFPDGQWSYVAIVGEGSPGTARMYTNGALAGSRTHTLPVTNAFPFNIGGGGVFDTLAANGNYFNGQIDEVAVFDKALTGAQIATHYFSTIGSPPIITRQPQGTNTFEGANIVLRVEVAGPGPFFYQWLDFGSPIPGQTNATLVFSNASVIQSSTYSVVVSNAFGSVASIDVDVLIQAQQPPTITQQPQSINKYAGANASLVVVATGGINLRYQWQRGGTNVAAATNATLSFSNIQATNAGSYRVIVSNSSGALTSQVATITVITPVAGSYEEALAGLSPIAFWRFNETSGNIAFDSFGNNHATYTNTATNGIVAPRPPQFPGFEAGNRAATFDGVSGFVQGPIGLMNGLSNFTMVGWIRRETDQAARTGMFGQNDIVEFGYIDNNTLQLWTDGGLNITPNPFPNGAWAHVAVVGQGTPGGTARFYTNGVLAVTRTHTLPAANQFTFNIGGGGVFDATGNFFNGQIDELAVFNKALTGAEISQLYTKAVGQAAQISLAIVRDNIVEDSKPTGTRYDGANFGAAWQVRSNFDGSITRTGLMQFVSSELDQIVLAPNTNFNASAGTIMFWMRSTGTVTTAGDFGAMLFDRRPTNPGGPPGDVIVQTDAGHIFVQAASGSGGVNSFEGTRAVSDNRWHHIAYTYNQAAGGVTTIYVDGTLDRAQTNSAPWSWTANQRIELGRSHDPFWRAYNGFLDDFRIYNRILTPAEIAQVASSDALVDPAALQVRFNFTAPPTGVTLTWPGGGVLQRTGVVGPAAVWTDLSNAASPFIMDTRGASNLFFRVRQ